MVDEQGGMKHAWRFNARFRYLIIKPPPFSISKASLVDVCQRRVANSASRSTIRAAVFLFFENAKSKPKGVFLELVRMRFRFLFFALGDVRRGGSALLSHSFPSYSDNILSEPGVRVRVRVRVRVSGLGLEGQC